MGQLYPDNPKVLMLHAKYRHTGGEENSFEAEAVCFENLGFEVHKFQSSNAQASKHWIGALLFVFNPFTFVQFWRACRKIEPTVLYFNNLWPSLSPSCLLVARLLGIPSIQALRNYRMVAPSAKLDDCGRCIVCGGSYHPFSCIINGCYLSRSASLICGVAAVVNRVIVSGWQRHWYVAPSEKCRRLLVNGGLRRSRFEVRHNFLTSDNSLLTAKRPIVTFVGRLSAEKGILDIADAWPMGAETPVLEIVGEGPLLADLECTAVRNSNVLLRGHLPQEQVARQLASSLFSVVPSQWAEPFGRVAIESLAAGTPVLTTGYGALGEIVGPAGVILAGPLHTALAECLSPGGWPAPYEEMVEACRDRYATKFSLHAASLDLAALLEMVLAEATQEMGK